MHHGGVEKEFRRPKGWRGTKATSWLEPEQAFRLFAEADRLDLNSGKPWSKADLDDFKQCLALGDSAQAIADFLCRDVGEVRAKIGKLRAIGPEAARRVKPVRTFKS